MQFSLPIGWAQAVELKRRQLECNVMIVSTMFKTGMSGLALNWVRPWQLGTDNRLAPSGTNTRLFHIRLKKSLVPNLTALLYLSLIRDG